MIFINLFSKALEKMPNWNQGVNNLLFSFVTGNSDALKLEHGSAMVAAAGLSTFSYRNKFDLALPSYTILQRQPIVTRKKDINLLVVQGNEVHDKLKPLIENLKHKPGIYDIFTLHSIAEVFYNVNYVNVNYSVKNSTVDCKYHTSLKDIRKYSNFDSPKP